MSVERNKNTPSKEAHLRILRAIQANPDLSQRDLARELGISLGKVNYCLRALLQGGWIKTRNFKNSKNKIAYSYLVSPKGIEQKLKLTKQFLEKKQNEFDLLRREIRQLCKETSQTHEDK